MLVYVVVTIGLENPEIVVTFADFNLFLFSIAKNNNLIIEWPPFSEQKHSSGSALDGCDMCDVCTGCRWNNSL